MKHSFEVKPGFTRVVVGHSPTVAISEGHPFHTSDEALAARLDRVPEIQRAKAPKEAEQS